MREPLLILLVSLSKLGKLGDELGDRVRQAGERIREASQRSDSARRVIRAEVEKKRDYPHDRRWRLEGEAERRLSKIKRRQIEQQYNRGRGGIEYDR